MRILVIQTAFIGDVILGTAVLESLHSTYPEARIDYLVRKGNESLLSKHPFLNEVLVWDKKKRKNRNLFGMLFRIRRNRYDLVVNLHRFASSGMLTAFSGAKDTRGFDKNPWSFAFRKRFPHPFGTRENPIHEVDRNQSLIADLCGTNAHRPKLYPGDEDRMGVDASQPYVVMAPASVWFTKQWPEEKWVELVQAIGAFKRVILTGGPGDVALCDRILEKAGVSNALNLAGKLSFLQSAAWMEKADMNYVNDSAPLHIASSMNAPTAAIFCSTVPEFGFTPLSDRHFILETDRALACRPCGLHGKKSCPLGHFHCSDIDIQKLASLAVGST